MVSGIRAPIWTPSLPLVRTRGSALMASAGTAMLGCNTHDMIVVHRVFRREFRLLPDSVRAVGGGDTARATVVGPCVQELVEALNCHHAAEDELIWPRLREQRELDTSAVERMEGQHERLAEILEQLHGVLPPWIRTADAGTGGELAGLSELLFCALDEHLDDEERTILPIVASVLTRRQWDDALRRGLKGLPRNSLY